MSLMRTDWNVVAELYSGRDHFATGKWHLDRLGALPGETSDSELLVATVPDVDRWLATLLDKWRVGWSIFEDFRYIRPVREKMSFDSHAEFYDRVGELVLEFASEISGREATIHVEHRDFDESDDEPPIRRILRRVLRDQLDVTCQKRREDLGGRGVLIDLEIVEGTAGVSVWTTEERERYPFLGFVGGGPRPRPEPVRPRRI